MRNKLIDLNNHLFAELERLSDEDLKGDELADEIKRAKSISDISARVIGTANIAIQAAKLQAEYNGNPKVKMLEEIMDEGEEKAAKAAK